MCKLSIIDSRTRHEHTLNTSPSMRRKPKRPQVQSCYNILKPYIQILHVVISLNHYTSYIYFAALYHFACFVIIHLPAIAQDILLYSYGLFLLTFIIPLHLDILEASIGGAKDH